MFDTKLTIGRSFSDDVVKKDAKHFPFIIKKGNNDKVQIKVEFEGARQAWRASGRDDVRCR